MPRWRKRQQRVEWSPSKWHVIEREINTAQRGEGLSGLSAWQIRVRINDSKEYHNGVVTGLLAEAEKRGLVRVVDGIRTRTPTGATAQVYALTDLAPTGARQESLPFVL